jgi:hypothetical protein
MKTGLDGCDDTQLQPSIFMSGSYDRLVLSTNTSILLPSIGLPLVL